MAHPHVVAPAADRPKLDHGVEAASQSFVAGNFVYVNSGAVTECASDATLIDGIAISTASGTTSSISTWRPTCSARRR